MKHIDLHNYEAFLLDYSEGNLCAEDIALLNDFILAHPELEINLGDFNLPYISDETHIADFKNSLKRTENEIPDEEIINYLEGNLSDEKKLDFENKLDLDKDLASDLESYRNTILVPDNSDLYEHKAELLRSGDDLVLNNTYLLYLEDQLSNADKLQFDAELKANTGMQKEFELFSKTLLTADSSIVYPDKEELKKESRIIPLFNWKLTGSIAAALLLTAGLFSLIKFYNVNQNNTNVLSVVKKTSENTQKKLNKPAETPVVAETVIVPEKKTNKIPSEKNNSVNTVATNSKETPSARKDVIQEKPEDKHEGTESVAELADVKEQKIVHEEHEPFEKQKIDIVQNTVTPRYDSSLNKRNYLALAEDIFDEVYMTDSEGTEKKSFWKRAVQLARKANKLGVKAIDGQEDSENRYRLSFNSFSVEKK